MKRRHFLSMTAAVALAPETLSVWAAEQQRAKPRRRPAGAAHQGRPNIFAEPPAVEPITGFLPNFHPVTEGTMKRAFRATFASVICQGSGARSLNTVDRQDPLVVTFDGNTCTTREVRRGRPSSVVNINLRCAGPLNAVAGWKLESTIDDVPEAHLVEHGAWDGTAMTVKTKSWTLQRPTGKLLIGKWALLPLLAAGRIKSKPLDFDLLDNSTLRPNQTLQYTGAVEIAVAGGTVRLDCYAQTGWGVVPTHYLVDSGGRVQLITATTVNWALTQVRAL